MFINGDDLGVEFNTGLKISPTLAPNITTFAPNITPSASVSKFYNPLIKPETLDFLKSSAEQIYSKYKDHREDKRRRKEGRIDTLPSTMIRPTTSNVSTLKNVFTLQNVLLFSGIAAIGYFALKSKK